MSETVELAELAEQAESVESNQFSSSSDLCDMQQKIREVTCSPPSHSFYKTKDLSLNSLRYQSRSLSNPFLHSLRPMNKKGGYEFVALSKI